MKEDWQIIRKIIAFTEWDTQDYYIRKRERWFYKFKAITCYLLRRQTEDSYDSVIVAYLASGSYPGGEYTTYWWEEVLVGHGILSNWWCTIDQDSTP